MIRRLRRLLAEPFGRYWDKRPPQHGISPRSAEVAGRIHDWIRG